MMVQKTNNEIPSRSIKADDIEKKSDFNSFVLTEKLKDTITVMDEIRSIIGQPIIIVDGCRFRGKQTSFHFFKNFCALDIWTKGYNSVEFMQVIEDNDLGTGRGLYLDEDYIHLDTRNGKSSKEGKVERFYRNEKGNYKDQGQDYFKKPFAGYLKTD